MKTSVVFGAGGAIGSALLTELAKRGHRAIGFTRQSQQLQNPQMIIHQVDYLDEQGIQAVLAAMGQIDHLIVATGMLHSKDLMPEKAIAQLNKEHLASLFMANTIIPAMIIKHCLPFMVKNGSLIGALSARVGSISDNRLGGWHAYRCSKAALNMLIKTIAIELARRDKQSVVVGLHPGTVDSHLSKPFQSNIPADQLFTPSFAARALLDVFLNLDHEASGRCFAWDGKEISA